MHMLPDIHEASQGRWRGILSQFGMSQKELSGKHGPCPMCGGVDRFRFDDKGGRGTWFCNSCGAGSGVDLVMKLKGWQFKDAVTHIRPLVGLAQAEAPKSGMSEDDKRQFRVNLWNESRPIEQGDYAHRYFAARGIDQNVYPPSLRFCKSARYSASKSFPAIIAAIQDADGKAVSLHRTFLQDGEKAPVDNPRMVTPGSIPNGSAVRLAKAGSVLGIAEGIETAMAAGDRFNVPTWAAINAGLLAEWEPPHGVTEVVIFGDNDAGYAGQAAAFALARRMARKKIQATVHIPPLVGTDWADVKKADEDATSPATTMAEGGPQS